MDIHFEYHILAPRPKWSVQQLMNRESSVQAKLRSSNNKSSTNRVLTIRWFVNFYARGKDHLQNFLPSSCVPSLSVLIVPVLEHKEFIFLLCTFWKHKEFIFFVQILETQRIYNFCANFGNTKNLSCLSSTATSPSAAAPDY